MQVRPKFSVGDVVHHRRFDYRGVIVDVDPVFEGTDDWYEAMARSRPPKDQPWYHVLVDGALHSTYVAERHLQPDRLGGQIDHPALGQYFNRFIGGRYYRAGSSH
ncbi:heat shock protein HspQ [Aquisalimonas sp.]|uniref:heat shock protein HspQ n=1 Tax=unclassified Aquisalimonas TaxID=2644645 RepID=UPI0025BF005F|nr:heat shock protein HspQ [Aquisalimonas sp.]